MITTISVRPYVVMLLYYNIILLYHTISHYIDMKICERMIMKKVSVSVRMLFNSFLLREPLMLGIL